MSHPVPYQAFRTGLSFADVLQELKREAAQAFELEGRRMFVTRRTVLGRWHQHKQAAYSDYRRYFHAYGNDPN